MMKPATLFLCLVLCTCTPKIERMEREAIEQYLYQMGVEVNKGDQEL